MKWFLVYQKKLSLRALNTNIIVEEFNSKLDLLMFGVNNRTRQYGENWVISAKGKEKFPYDAHAEIEILKKKQNEAEEKLLKAVKKVKLDKKKVEIKKEKTRRINTMVQAVKEAT